MQSANLSPLMLPEIRREFLTRVMEGKAIERVSIRAADAQLAYDFGAPHAQDGSFGLALKMIGNTLHED